jgi:hypothetical protein
MKYSIRRVFEHHEAYVHAVQTYLRGNEITPQMYSPPLFLIETWIDIPDHHKMKLGNVLFSRETKGVSHSSAFRALESINEGIIKSEAYMNSLRSLEFFVEQRGIVSDQGNFYQYSGTPPIMPLWMKSFFGRKKYARIYYTTYYSKLPVRTRELPRTEDISRIFQNPVDLVFKGLQKPYNEMLRLSRKAKDGEDIIREFHTHDYRDRETFQSAIDMSLTFFRANEEPPAEDKTPVEIFGTELFELSIDDDLIDFQLGEATFDDILDEYFDDEMSDYFEESDEYDEYAYMDISGRTTLTDVKPLLGDDL